MTGERRVDRDGIHIDRDVADAVAIEEELDANIVGPYRFPIPGDVASLRSSTAPAPSSWGSCSGPSRR